MKNLNLFLFAAGAALLTACGGAEEAATEPVVANYTLDAAASTLEWKGYKKGNETGIKKHVGTECVWIPSSLHSVSLLANLSTESYAGSFLTPTVSITMS